MGEVRCGITQEDAELGWGVGGHRGPGEDTAVWEGTEGEGKPTLRCGLSLCYVVPVGFPVGSCLTLLETILSRCLETQVWILCWEMRVSW